MAISFQKALSVHEHAMQLRSKRTQVLANNLVNADTPNFKARDIDFASALKAQMAGAKGAGSLRATHDKHLKGIGIAAEPALMYRTPLQPSLDGNTVDEQLEMTTFAKNAMDFQASFHFLSSRFKGLRNALKGE